MKLYLYIFILAFALWGCIEPFEPEVGQYDRTLVVDGLLSNSDEPSKVVLSYSFPYSAEETSPVQGATVVIEEEQGGSYRLEEVQEGVYQTDPTVFKGTTGIRYRLRVKIPGGDQFESDWELMKPAPPIEEVRVEYEERTPNDPTLDPVPGVQFYLSTQDAENNTRYYRWEFEETFLFYIPHPPFIKVRFGENPGNGQDEADFVPFDEYEGGSCWKTENSTQVIIATTDNLTQDVVHDFPLHFVDNTTSRLFRRYSLFVKQYAISKEYHRFLRKIVEVNQTSGSLFDPIPNEVFGNVRSADGKDVPVLGYFAAAGISEQRIFVEKDELPRFSVASGPRCQNDTLDYNFRDLYYKVRNGASEAYDYLYNDFGNIIGFVVSEKECTRCAANGATNQEPDFW